MKRSFFIYAFFCLSAGLIAGCDSTSPNGASDPVVAERASDIPSDPIIGLGGGGRPVGTNTFTFFNVRTGDVVAQTDSATTKWDLGFRGTTIIVNGGTSGPGNGAAKIVEGVFADITDAVADDMQTDSESGYAIPVGSGNGWYNYNPALQTVSPVPGRVLIIRTADGRYAKVSIISYYKGAPTTPSASDEARYLTFDYAFQPDGSLLFE